MKMSEYNEDEEGEEEVVTRDSDDLEPEEEPKTREERLMSALMDDVLSLNKEIPIDYFIDQGRFPIGTKKPYASYKSKEKIPEDEFVTFQFAPKGEFTSKLFIGLQGTGKTSLQKRFIYYDYRAGAKVMCFDPKGDDLPIMGYMGTGNRLHPYERPRKLPVVPYVPSYVAQEDLNAYKGKFNIFAEDIHDYNQRDDWTNFGMSEQAINTILEAIKKIRNPAEIYRQIVSKSGSEKLVKLGVSHGTRQSISGRLGNLLSGGYFSKEFNTVNFHKHWFGTTAGKKNNEIPVLAYFLKEPRWIASSFHKNMYRILDIAKKRALTRGHPDKYSIWVDDSTHVVGNDMDESLNSSVKTAKASLHSWRRYGFDMNFATQTPELLHPSIFDMSKWIICSRLSNASYMKRAGIDNETLKAIYSLDYQPNARRSEFMLIHPNKFNYEKFYPLGAIVGNSW